MIVEKFEEKDYSLMYLTVRSLSFEYIRCFKHVTLSLHLI